MTRGGTDVMKYVNKERTFAHNHLYMIISSSEY